MSVLFFWMVAHLHYVLAFLLAATLAARRSRGEAAVYGAVAALSVFLLQHGLPSVESHGGGLWLSVLWGLPCMAALLLMILPIQDGGLLRRLALAALLLDIVIAARLLCTSWDPGWHYQLIGQWVPALGVRYHVAMDGISAWLSFCVSLLGALSVWFSGPRPQAQLKVYCVACLLLQGALLGALLAIDLFLFVLFWELALVPLVMLAGMGTEHGGMTSGRSTRLLIRSLAGSGAMLLALLYLAWEYRAMAGHVSFDLLDLRRLVLTERAGWFCFAAFALSLLGRMPLWPTQGWLPRLDPSVAGSPLSILSTAALPVGAYAYVRIGLALFEDQVWRAGATLAWLSILGSILCTALCAWRQPSLRRLFAFALVSQGGVVLLGLLAATQASLQGALLHTVSSTLAFAGSFLLLEALRRRGCKLHAGALRGLVHSMPVCSILLLLFALTLVGLPGTSGFVGSFMVLSGTMVSQPLGSWAFGHAVVACIALIFSGAILLRRISSLFGGPVRDDVRGSLKDLSPWESAPLSLLVALVLVLGWRPQLMLQASSVSVTGVLSEYVAGRSAALENRGMLTSSLTPLPLDSKQAGPPVPPRVELDRGPFGWGHGSSGKAGQKGSPWR